jgi:hypothetical protein
MGLDYLKKIHSRNDDSDTIPEHPVSVYLYPYANTSELKSTVKSDGTVTKAIKDALDQLCDYNAIDYYAIYRWRFEDSETTYPNWGDIDDCEYSAIAENFKYWLGESVDLSNNCYENNVGRNGTNDNYYGSYSGVHQLIHNGSTGCNETSGYAPDTAGGEHWGQTAFQEGRVTWSPVCSNTSLEEAAAIQETVHMIMHPSYDRTVDCSDATRPDCSYYTDPRQHSVGTLNYYRDFDYTVSTPMLTYHWDDFDNYAEDPYCPCPVDRETAADSHTRDLTTCAKESVYDTARNLDNLC